MFRNNYDNDSVTFSPQGRIFQIEYAQEAVKQGAVVVGIASKTHVVLAALKRNAEELSSYQKKIIPIDTHYGIALAGLASDARVLSNYMKQQSLASHLTLARPIPLHQIVSQIAARAQSNTQNYGKRPYGVGLLVGGIDSAGTHLWEFLPSGVTTEMIADAIGARSQMARTYLERILEGGESGETDDADASAAKKKSSGFDDCSREELVRHALRALRESLPQDKELGIENTSVGLVGKDENFKLYEGEEIRGWLDDAFGEAGQGTATDSAPAEAPAESMDTDT